MNKFSQFLTNCLSCGGNAGELQITTKEGMHIKVSRYYTPTADEYWTCTVFANNCQCIHSSEHKNKEQAINAGYNVIAAYTKEEGHYDIPGE